MTTQAAAQFYESQHLSQWREAGWAVFNPHNKPEESLPVIYGFNNGGSSGWMQGCLLAEDGTQLGGHCCSSEGYMPHDLGVLEGSRPDRHETFQKHYPDGYRMECVGYKAIDGHEKLVQAIKLANAKGDEAESA